MSTIRFQVDPAEVLSIENSAGQHSQRRSILATLSSSPSTAREVAEITGADLASVSAQLSNLVNRTGQVVPGVYRAAPLWPPHYALRDATASFNAHFRALSVEQYDYLKRNRNWGSQVDGTQFVVTGDTTDWPSSPQTEKFPEEITVPATTISSETVEPWENVEMKKQKPTLHKPISLSKFKTTPARERAALHSFLRGETIKSCTRRQVARYIGASNETAARAIHQLMASGMLQQITNVAPYKYTVTEKGLQSLQSEKTGSTASDAPMASSEKTASVAPSAPASSLLPRRADRALTRIVNLRNEIQALEDKLKTTREAEILAVDALVAAVGAKK